MATAIYTPSMLRGAGTRGVPEIPAGSSFSNTKSILFDGNDDYINCGNDSSLQPTGAITLSAWAKLTASSYSDYKSLITQDHPAYAGLYNGYQLRWGIHTSLLQPYLNFTLCDNNTPAAYAISGLFAPSTPLNTWHHICGIWDGATMELFFDGVSMGTLAFSGTITYNTAIDTLIGRQRIGFYHSGNIDEVSIFNSAKSIGDIWNGTGKPTDLTGESGLVSWYRMGDKVTSWPTIPDQVGSNNGTAYNENEATMVVSDVP